MSTIYLVTANVDYEGFSVIKALTNKDKAYKLRDDCENYDKTKAKWPPAARDKIEWKKQNKIWQANHPGGNECYADCYEVIETELD